MSRTKPMLADRAGDSDEERRLREALNRMADKFLGTVDAALQLRTADGDVKRTRHQARNHMQDACLKAMEAMAIKQADEVDGEG